MTDTLTKQQRSALMAKVRSVDTKPEWILRRGLHRLGFRYRLHSKSLPGKPDLVFARHKAVVFVHGCYWHRHPGCKEASMPKSNVEFWEKKFATNTARDEEVTDELRRRGWRVLVIWECELTKHAVETIERVAVWLRGGEDGTMRVGYNNLDAGGEEVPKVAEKQALYHVNSLERPD